MKLRVVFDLVVGLLVAASSMLICAGPAGATLAPTTRVIIIPGQSVGALPFQPFADNLTARGYPATVLDLKGFDLVGDATAIGVAVDRIRAAHPYDRVVLVGHSVGGVSARWFLKELGGARTVATYVAIGAPQYGSPGACAQQPGAGVCPGSTFMTALNKGIDTPGPTEYYDVGSVREWVDGHLDGRQCRVTPIPANETLPRIGLEHTFEPFDPKVWDVTVAALHGQCRGQWVSQPDGVLNYHLSASWDAPVH